MAAKEIILEVIAEVSGVERHAITPASELVGDLGIDSPKALALLVELEERLDVEIDDERVAHLNTVADVIAAIGDWS